MPAIPVLASAPVLVGFPQLYHAYGVGRSEAAYRLSLWRAIRDGSFPAPLRLGANRRAWRMAEIQAWEASLQRVTYAPVLASAAAGPEAA